MNELPSDASGLHVTNDGGVATLWMNRPAKQNAVTDDMWVGIGEHCRQLAKAPTVRLLVVRGVGDHFCAGADVAGLGVADRGEYQRANEAADDALGSFPKPTLAVITGSC